MSANDKSKKTNKNSNLKKDEKPTSDSENRNTSFDYIDEENQENFNLMSCCVCNNEINESQSNFNKENFENKNANQIQKAKDSIDEYQKINKKLSFLAELIENNFDGKEKPKNNEKQIKSNSDNNSKQNNFVFYPQFISANLIQSINTNELFLSFFDRKSLSDFTESDKNKDKSDKAIKENRGSELIDIDDILEMENFDFKNKIDKNCNAREEPKNQAALGFDESPFRENFAVQFSNDKKRFKFENRFVKDLSSYSSLLLSENGESNGKRSESYFIPEEFNANKKAFNLKKKMNYSNSDQEIIRNRSNDINKNLNRESKVSVDESKMDIVETSNVKLIMEEENNNGEKSLKANLDFKAFSLKKLKLFYEKLMKFNEELNTKSFDEQMKEDLIFNKYILTNKLLNFHPLKNQIKEKYKEIPYNHLKVKMRDNTHFRLNRANTGINTQAFINQINRHSGTVISTLNDLLNSLRNTNNLFQNHADDDNNMEVDHEDLIEDEFFENDDDYENENDEHTDEEYETVEENSEEGSNQGEEHLQ